MSKTTKAVKTLASSVPLVDLPEALVTVEFTEDKHPYFAGEISGKKYVVDCRSVRPKPQVGQVWCVLVEQSFNDVVLLCSPVSHAVIS